MNRITTHPGDVLKEELEVRGISQKKFAEALSLPYTQLNEILNGKRPVTTEDIDNAVREIEFAIQNSLDREVTSIQIGELAMEKLKNIDDVAYVRFASVYRQFKDINTFMEELSKILTKE